MIKPFLDTVFREYDPQAIEALDEDNLLFLITHRDGTQETIEPERIELVMDKGEEVVKTTVTKMRRQPYSEYIKSTKKKGDNRFR